MEEIRRAPRSGLVAASLFSGAGGSCLGMEMAGFDVRFASEFVASARATHAINFPSCPIDSRDVRELPPEDVLRATGPIDLLAASPPCSAFSELVRKNTSVEERWGRTVAYSDTRQRTDDLFSEFVRILRGTTPLAFVAENVRGLVLGKSKAHFAKIMGELRASGYRVSARLLDAQWLGVPQQRHRLIFVGFREDLGIEPTHPTPLARSISLREALVDLPPDPEAQAAASFVGYAIEAEWRKLSRGQRREDKYFGLWRAAWDRPTNAVTATTGKIGGASLAHPDVPRKFTVAELKRICSFPDDFALAGTYEQQVERLGRAVPPLMMRAVAEVVRDALLEKDDG
jgi:DNA (cytosine-5)-methyltransferase 1